MINPATAYQNLTSQSHFNNDRCQRGYYKLKLQQRMSKNFSKNELKFKFWNAISYNKAAVWKHDTQTTALAG